MGVCYENGDIEIEIKTLKGDIHPIDEIVDTVCHELAHITCHKHSVKWRATYEKYLKWACANLM